MKYILSETLHYFESDNGNKYMTHDGITFYTQNRSKVYNEELIKSLQDMFISKDYIIIFFENLEEIAVPISNCEYKLLGEKLVELTFERDKLTCLFPDWLYNSTPFDRLLKYNDLVGIITPYGKTYYSIWEDGYGDANKLQQNIIDGDTMTIKFKAD